MRHLPPLVHLLLTSLIMTMLLITPIIMVLQWVRVRRWVKHRRGRTRRHRRPNRRRAITTRVAEMPIATSALAALPRRMSGVKMEDLGHACLHRPDNRLVVAISSRYLYLGHIEMVRVFIAMFLPRHIIAVPSVFRGLLVTENVPETLSIITSGSFNPEVRVE